jgi:nucleoside-diphosphate-sugar epimerase
METWTDRRVVVTGGASFIGSHLVTALIDRGANVRVVDDFSTGRHEYIAHLPAGSIELVEADLREAGVAARAVDSMEVVFHLAADHGGRGYLDTHQAKPATNLYLDGVVFWEAVRAEVEKIVFSSSACVYPMHLQMDPDATVYLSEDLVTPPYDADNMYGWAKLMGELTLQAYSREFGVKTVSCRYFTAYGPRAKESHAVTAMIAKAFVGADPFEIWGDGRQIRNWTYVDDVVEGTLAAAERIDDGTAVNIGTMERTTVLEAANAVLEVMGHDAEIMTRPEMPTGPLNRVADNSLAKRLLDWEPEVSFREGLALTAAWYREHKDVEEVRGLLEAGFLMERTGKVAALGA